MERMIRENCPVCQGTDVYKVTEKQGSSVLEMFSVYRCNNCSCAYVHDPINKKHLDEIYSEQYFSGGGMDETVDYLENLDRQDFFFEKYDYQIGSELSQYKIKKDWKWLDLGCALGNTLDWAFDRYSVETYGVEFSELGRNISSSKGHRILGKTIEEVSSEFEGQFDIITCYEVLEHLYEPDQVMSSISRLLKDGGVFHYSTGAPPKDLLMGSWSYLRPEVHITFYSPKCMKELFSRHGLMPNPRQSTQINKNFKHYRLSFKQKIKIALPNFIVRFLRGELQPDGIRDTKGS